MLFEFSTKQKENFAFNLKFGKQNFMGYISLKMLIHTNKKEVKRCRLDMTAHIED